MSKKESKKEVLIYFRTVQELEEWLENNSSTSEGIWLEIYKKRTKIKSLSWQEIVETALCFGWIDSQRLTIDQDRYKQRITPRRAKSPWSKRNTEKVEKLINEGKMRQSGLLEVELAKQDGRWANAYDPPSEAKPSRDFLEVLQKNNLEAVFDSLKASEKYHMLYQIQTAKRQETKERRIKKFSEELKRKTQEKSNKR